MSNKDTLWISEPMAAGNRMVFRRGDVPAYRQRMKESRAAAAEARGKSGSSRQ